MPGLMLVHGNQPETLRDLTVSWLQRYPLAPLENELILVQSNGIAQWLKLALAAEPNSPEGAGLGVAAALDFSLPARFLWRAYRSVLGKEAVPEQSPFDKGLLTWRLMRLLPQIIAQPVYAPLQRFLQDDLDTRKRFQLASELADLFDQYQVYRADWLDAWAAGNDILIQARGSQIALPEEQLWQAALWRELLHDVSRTGLAALVNSGRAAVHAQFMCAISDLPDNQQPACLPRRIVVFGISALPRQSLEVLAALSRWTQVLMCIHNPCEHFWADIVPDKDLLRASQSRQKRRLGVPPELNEELIMSHAHPLLAAWGKQGRDFIGLLDEHDSDASRTAYLPQFTAIQQRIDLFSSPGQATMLQQLQDDILDLRPVAESLNRWPDFDPEHDQSIRFHSAHSPQREVEILHDQLLDALNTDVSLRPRDIMVMVPDINQYAPHIQAVFGLPNVNDEHDKRYIPYNVADQNQQQINPLLNAVDLLLNLPNSRVTVSNLLDLLDVPAIRNRFDLPETALPIVRAWIQGANIRWGLHTEHRKSLGLPVDDSEAAHNTWLFGLRRMLLAYAVGAQKETWQGIQAYDEIGGLDAALLGPLLNVFDTLDTTWRSLSKPATVNIWCQRLNQLLDQFFVDDDDGDAYTLQQLKMALEAWQVAGEQAQLTEELPLSLVKDHWLAQLNETHLSQRFFAGSVTFATLMPMRAIPFRYVCLLGMNDGDYPRSRVPADFDLMGQDYRPGDRSRREDDRYLFLEALLSARENLYISWVGRSIQDNTIRPPSVLLGQLREHLASGWRLAGQVSTPILLLEKITQEHPLQPFSHHYYPPSGNSTKWFTYAQEWRPESKTNQSEINTTSLAPMVLDEPLSLRELGDFLKNPVQTFFRQRLNITFSALQDTIEDHEPFRLDGLELWRLQNELIQAQAHAIEQGSDHLEVQRQCLQRMHDRGELADGSFADLMTDDITTQIDVLVADYQAALQRWPIKHEQDQELSMAVISTDGYRLEVNDWVTDLRADEQGNLARVYLETSNLIHNGHYRADRIIQQWVTHLAAQLNGTPLTSLIISKAGKIQLQPVDEKTAYDYLSDLMFALHDGMCRPLPLESRTALAWLRSNDMQTAQTVYEGSYLFDGELSRSLYLQHSYPDFGRLTRSGEFEVLAKRLLQPLHAACFVPDNNKEASTQTKISKVVS